MKKYKKEIELVDDFCLFLEQNGCEYKRELRKGSYHSEGYYDIVIKKDDLFISIEAKLKSFNSVYHQALQNAVLCTFSYILYPRKPKYENILNCKKYGIGIIIPNGNTFLYLIKSKPYSIKYRPEILLRNWNENRYGRPINTETSRELPEDYDLEKLKKLQPTYEWVKNKDKKNIN